MESEKILNIYAQYAHHTEAIVIGNEQGLIALWAALNEILFTGKEKAKTDVFCSDGEGYTIIAEKKSDCNNLLVPYTAEYAKERR